MPAEIVQKRPGPVRRLRLGGRELEAALRPLEQLVRIGDRDHVGGVAGEERLAAPVCTFERRLEQRDRSFRLAARAELAAALEIDSHPGYGVVTRKPFRLPEQLLTTVEVTAQPLDARELRQHLGPSRIRMLVLELCVQPPRAGAEVVEVPQGAQPVPHAPDCRRVAPLFRGGVGSPAAGAYVTSSDDAADTLNLYDVSERAQYDQA